MKTRLGQIAHARSGDKGASANVGVIAFTPAGYDFLRRHLTPALVHRFFKPLNLTRVTRYEMPNLGALNFILHNILDGGGSRSLRIDAQGKALGQAILELEINAPPALLQTKQSISRKKPKTTKKGSKKR